MSDNINKPYFMFGKGTDEESDELPFDIERTDYPVPNLLDRSEKLANVISDSAEILGNCVLYNMEKDDFVKAKYYYEHLKKIEKSLYSPNAFMAVIKYEMTDPVKNVKSLRTYMSAFRNIYPKNEDAYVRHALLEQFLSNGEVAMKVLNEAIENAINPANAYAMLAKIQLDEKAYEGCRLTVTKALSSTVREDSMLVALLLLYFVMSQESELENRMANGESIKRSDFDLVIDGYEDLLDLEICREIYKEKIEERVGVLNFWRKRYENK